MFDPIHTLYQQIKSRSLSPVDLVQSALSSVAMHNSRLNALISVRDESDVLAEAKSLADESPRSPLHGLPYVLKDAYVTEGIETTSASSVLKGFIPPYSATVYRKLKEAGAILIGKANMDAWGHGGTSENTDFGSVKNPWDTSRVAGGSSGGCAAAIASGMAVFAIGEDTGGSIRNPASWTNTTGLKVTYGRVSRYGAIAYASSFDTVGPMGKTAQDCAHVLQVIAGVDPYDATSSPEPVDNYVSERIPKQPLTLALPKEMYGQGLDSEIKAALLRAAEVFGKMGHKIIEISMPIFEYGLPVYYLIGPSETSSNLGRYDGVRYGAGRSNFTEETMRRIMIGTYALSAGYYDAYYRKAQKVRTLLRQEYAKALKKADVLLMPVTPTPPTKLGELVSDPLQNLLADIYTTSQNPVGVPSLALPAGFTRSKLPIGMQLVGNMFKEKLLLSLGSSYQKQEKWHEQEPA